VAEAAAGRRVLVVSTDPAHSLGDALAVRLGAAPRRVRTGSGSLQAAELDAPRAFRRWMDEHRRALGDILEHGTWLDREDVETLLDLSLPGIDELVGLLEIDRLSRSSSADLIVVDTAPTGHTLRLLAAPDTVSAVAGVLDDAQEQHRIVREQLARVRRPEAADRLIALLADQAHRIGERLRQPRTTTLCWVMLPEDLAIAETGDAVAALEAVGIPVRELIVNQVLPQGGACAMCDRRRHSERVVVARLRRTLGRRRRVRVVPAELREPRGWKRLATIGRRLMPKGEATEDTEDQTGLPLRVVRSGEGAVALSQPRGARTVAAESLEVFRGARLLFFGGKGGVGKTTVAAAAAVRLARADPEGRVLLLSTDPAHSLADVFRGTVGDTPATLRGAPANLFVREIDAPRALAARRAALEGALDEITAAFGAANVQSGERASELMNLAPPGVDELFGMLSLLEAREHYRTVVVDTAPTGHALRLLEMPDTAREWVQVLLRVLLKYRSLVRPGQLAVELVDVSKAIRELQRLLHDPVHTRFIAVTRAAEVPRAETERLLARLRRLALAVPAIVSNAMTLAPGRCSRCRAVAAAERAQIRALRAACGRRSRECVIIQTPLSAPPPRGVRALERWGARWLVADG
jgi:arsenite-transporting ATPase